MQRFPEARAKHLADNDSLLETGVVDSLGILDVVSYIEGQLSIQLSDDDLTPENFDSVAAIAHFVDSNRL
jgi:acyl carrier protein